MPEEHIDIAPGVTSPNLSVDPLITEGEATVGPDNLRPSVPAERRELEDLGFGDSWDLQDRQDDYAPFESLSGPMQESGLDGSLDHLFSGPEW